MDSAPGFCRQNPGAKLSARFIFYMRPLGGQERYRGGPAARVTVSSTVRPAQSRTMSA